MKVKLLKKFKKRIKTYYSREKEVKDYKSGEPIEGRFVVKDPINNLSYYCTTRKEAIIRRRKIILVLLLDYRVRNYWQKKKIQL